MFQARLAGAAVLAALAAGSLAAPAAADRYSGTLRNLHADDPAHGRAATAWGLERDGETRRLLPTAAPASGAGDAVFVEGETGPGGLVGTVAPARTVAHDQRGAHSLLVVLINFDNDTSQPWTVDAARSRVFTASDSTNAYFREESWDQIGLTGLARADGDVTGWHTV